MTPNPGTRVVVAMSGGVDSSVAAALLAERGYQVIGLMLRLWSEPASGRSGGSVSNRCCTPDAMALARQVAAQFSIPFYVIDTQDVFRRRVVDFFLQGYASGVTPNPCMECNRVIRWDFLLQKALSLGATHLATGHYARVRQVDGEYQLLRAVDQAKDQSYVLSVMGQAQLSRALFPIGEYAKPDVRELARRFALPVAEGRESQDLCFLADRDYRRFLRTHAPQAVQPGPVFDVAGQQLGQHEGLPFYTIGQRKGLGISAPTPLYVVATDPAANALIVGPREALGRRQLSAERVNWISGLEPAGPIDADVKIRYRATPVPARVTPAGFGRVEVAFDEPLRDITPGQAAVFYQGEICLGGGIIE